jgi:hypothetical protein
VNEERKIVWVSVFAAFAEVWPWLEPSPAKVAVWDGALADLSVEQLRRGAARVLANHSGSQPPTPGEIRDGVLGKLSWETVRSDYDGKVRGRREVRQITSESLTPAPLGVLEDPNKPEVPMIVENAAAAELIAETAKGMQPVYRLALGEHSCVRCGRTGVSFMNTRDGRVCLRGCENFA